jgi:hypothetical protein
VAILKAAAKLIVREHAQSNFVGPALSLGVPEVYATAAELRRWLRDYGAAGATLPEEEVETSTNKFGKRLGWVNGRTFFRALGFSGFDSLDLSGADYTPQIVHDLNSEVDRRYHSNYRFVLDPGTLEHVFDVRTCLTNIVRVLAVGGSVVHLVPVYSYNGGYYSINPNVLHDFYRLNGFGRLRAFLIMWDRYLPYTAHRTFCYTYREDVLGSRHALADWDQVRYAPHLLLFAAKEREVGALQAPLQFGGNYSAQAASLPATRQQRLERWGKRLASAMQKALPLSLALYVQSAGYRRVTLYRARHAAGFWI